MVSHVATICAFGPLLVDLLELFFGPSNHCHELCIAMNFHCKDFFTAMNSLLVSQCSPDHLNYLRFRSLHHLLSLLISNEPYQKIKKGNATKCQKPTTISKIILANKISFLNEPYQKKILSLKWFLQIKKIFLTFSEIFDYWYHYVYYYDK